MALLLNIDTATPHASVCLSDNEHVLALKQHNEQREHASFVHTAIESMLNDAGINLGEIDAVAVTSGPGSYTGLRVGLSTAKGFCYALNKPLICINTLEVMTKAAINYRGSLKNIPESAYCCPMIDARRMEVFTAIYDSSLSPVIPPCSVILTSDWPFDFLPPEQPVYFFGNGSAKFKTLTSHKNGVFLEIQHTAADIVPLALACFKGSRFADTAYAEPSYFKEFYTTANPGKV